MAIFEKRRWPHTLLILSLTLFGGCTRAKPSLGDPKPPEVTVDYPTMDTVADYEDFTGRTESIPTVEIRARITGELKKVYFEDGVEVKIGDKLFDLDSRQYDAELDRARATVALSEADLKLKGILLVRARKLRNEGGSISQEDMDKATADLESAKASRDIAIANRDIAEVTVSYCHIEAPESGRISRKLIDVGNQVTANVTPLTTIVALDPMYAYFDVDERTVLRVRRRIQEGSLKSAKAQKLIVHVGLADQDGFPIEGIFDFSENRVDSGTGTLRLRIHIDNPESRKRRLLSPGMFVRIRFPIGDPKPAMLVPESALVSDQGQRHLYVLNDKDEVVYKEVKIGLQQGLMRVIQSGLDTKDRVIVNGLQRVRPKIKVNPSLNQKSESRNPSLNPKSESRNPSLNPKSESRNPKQ